MIKINKQMFLSFFALFLLVTSFTSKELFVYGFELQAKGIYFKENKKNIQTLGPFKIKYDLWNIKSKSGKLNTKNQIISAEDVSAIHPEILIWSDQITFFTNKNDATLNTPSISTWRGYHIESNYMHIDFSNNNLTFKKGAILTKKKNILECSQLTLNVDKSILTAKDVKLSLQLDTI